MFIIRHSRRVNLRPSSVPGSEAHQVIGHDRRGQWPSCMKLARSPQAQGVPLPYYVVVAVLL